MKFRLIERLHCLTFSSNVVQLLEADYVCLALAYLWDDTRCSKPEVKHFLSCMFASLYTVAAITENIIAHDLYNLVLVSLLELSETTISRSTEASFHGRVLVWIQLWLRFLGREFRVFSRSFVLFLYLLLLWLPLIWGLVRHFTSNLWRICFCHSFNYWSNLKN